jgi:ribonuclease E
MDDNDRLDSSGISVPVPVPAGPAEGATAPKVGDTRPKVGDTRPAPPRTDVPGGQGERSSRSRGRRGGRGRGRGRSGGESPAGTTARVARDDGPVMASAPAPADEEDTSRRSRSRRRRSPERKRPMGRYLMCVHATPSATHIATLEGRNLVEHSVAKATNETTQIDGNIYVGRVQNVLPGMEAAFIDIGIPKNGVLYRGDVQYDQEDVEQSRSRPSMRIEEMLKSGQTILCQVTKNPIGAKGARLTQEVSLPGRFVVLVPNSSAFGISKRLGDTERRRLRKITDEIRPDGHGLIVRTAAEGVSAEELRRDVQSLVAKWTEIEQRAATSNQPRLVYQDLDLAVRILREELNSDYRGVLIDDRELFDKVRDYVTAVNPELADRIEYYDTEAEDLPLFERYFVHEQLHKALDRKVWLPSGGSLIIERTEALTVIDVNTGKNIGKSNLEETVFRNNLEAAAEVAHQLRLRDIGGIIVIDFIDMETKQNREAVATALRDGLSRDKTRTQVFDISELGLVEMTRKRVSEGLLESVSTVCAVCEGRGTILDPELSFG